MEHRDFIYWLQGFFEVAKPVTLDAEQVEMIRRHLALCLVNVTARLDFEKLVPPYSVTCSAGIVKDNNSRIIAVC